MTQEEETLNAAKRLVATLEKSPGLAKHALIEFIDSMDWTVRGPGLIGDDELLDLAAAYLIRRGKSLAMGQFLLRVAYDHMRKPPGKGV